MGEVQTTASGPVVDGDLACAGRGCGYNLRTLPIKGVCPECGTPVAAALEAQRLARGRRFRNMAIGASLLAFAAVVILTFNMRWWYLVMKYRDGLPIWRMLHAAPTFLAALVMPMGVALLVYRRPNGRPETMAVCGMLALIIGGCIDVLLMFQVMGSGPWFVMFWNDPWASWARIVACDVPLIVLICVAVMFVGEVDFSGSRARMARGVMFLLSLTIVGPVSEIACRAVAMRGMNALNFGNQWVNVFDFSLWMSALALAMHVIAWSWLFLLARGERLAHRPR